MDYTSLIKIGLNANEAKVYIILLMKGSSSAGELIKESGFHRNIIYDNIEKLIDKGLVSYVLEGKKKIFRARPADSIVEMIEREQKALDEKKHAASLVVEEISKMPLEQKNAQEATVFRGVNGIKALMKDTLEGIKEYYVFGAPQSSIDIMTPSFWEIYNAKRERNGISIKMIFNEELREWSKNIKSNVTKIKFLPKKFDSLTETLIYGDKVAIIVWSEKPLATQIHDKQIASSYKKYFDILWKEAE